MTETISILIPTWNRASMLKKCIDSIFNQTYQDFKIIIVDDGSTDDTYDMLKNIKDDRIRRVMIDHFGIANARNELLFFCETDIACWQDDDDLMNKYRLENQLGVLKNNPDSYVIGNCQIFRKEKEIESDINERVISPTNKEMGFASMMFYTEDLPRFDESIGNDGGEDTNWIKQLKYKRIELYQVNYYIRYHYNRLGINKKNKAKGL